MDPVAQVMFLSHVVGNNLSPKFAHNIGYAPVKFSTFCVNLCTISSSSPMHAREHGGPHQSRVGEPESAVCKFQVEEIVKLLGRSGSEIVGADMYQYSAGEV